MKSVLSNMRSLSLVAGIGACLATSMAVVNPAQAFTLSFNPQNGSTENTGATADLDFSFLQEGNDVRLNLNIANTTNGTAGLGATQATLVGLAFDVLQGLTVKSYSAGTSNFSKLWRNVDLSPSNQFGTFDVGVSLNRNQFEGGNANGGLRAGRNAAVSFLFSGVGLNASAVETLFESGLKDGSLRAAARFQQVNAGGGSDKVLGGIVESGSESNPGNSAAVPEPASMLGLAAAGSALMAGKRLKRKNAEA